ncbi:lipocalin family protein [Flavobacterium sp. JP2137]|uniref:lipocalin family protein n=1 Tax=Flavobacterium sp. JP2137 TaxID=3414510 RepID=UPI003D2F9D59
MKRMLFALLPVLFLLGSCNQSISESDLKDINGYWEIEKAEMPDGEVKTYTINTMIDYFEIENNKGFRQKVMPQVDGDYLTNEVQETIEIVVVDGKTLMKYHTEFADWQEELLAISKEELVVQNEHDIKYYYKRAIPFSKK